MTQAEHTVSIDCIFLMLTWTRILVLNSKHIKLTSFLRKREKIVSQIIGKVKRNKHTDYESYLTFITTFNFTLHFCRALKAAGSAIWREIFRYSHGLRSQLVADWLPVSLHGQSLHLGEEAEHWQCVQCAWAKGWRPVKLKFKTSLINVIFFVKLLKSLLVVRSVYLLTTVK